MEEKSVKDTSITTSKLLESGRIYWGNAALWWPCFCILPLPSSCGTA